MGEPTNISILKGFLPNVEIQSIQGGGANIRTPRGIVTVWFKKRKYSLGGNWKYFTSIRDFADIVDQLINPAKKVAPIEPQPIQTGNRVQEAIDHISRKRDFILANQPDNKLATFCLTLISELQQYL